MSNLLLGERGYLGSYLCDNLECDILNSRKIHDNGKKYDFVINCIGKPDLEYCEAHNVETHYSNAGVIKDIKKFYPDSKIINFSSYYVYDDEGLCTEESNTTMQYNYCKQKLRGEILNFHGLNFRIGKLFGNPNGNQNKLTEHIIYNDDLKIDTTIFNPTSAQIVLKVLRNEEFIRKQSGIFNLSNFGTVSHYEYAVYILYKLNLKKKLYKIEANPRFSNYGRFAMSTEKIQKYCDLDPWQKDMDEYLSCIV